MTQPAQRPPASLQEKRPPVQPTSINPHSHELWILCSVPYSHSCLYPLQLCATARLRLRLLRRPSRLACAASIHENSPNILPRSRKREPDCAVNCSRLFSSSLGVQNWAASTSEAEWRGSCPCALQWHPGPHSFSQCLTVFGRQMHPHRGVAAPSLHPQSQHVGPHNSPNKRERRVGPSCASCGAWTFEVRWENILAHLNYIKERATVEDRRVFEQMCCCYFLSACSCGLSGAGEVWWSCWLFQPVNLLQLWMRCSE